MASGLRQACQIVRKIASVPKIGAQAPNFRVPNRGIVFSESGAIYERPLRTRFGVLKTFVVSLPFLYLGATAGKEVSAFLEENDIFVPDDDDDD